MTTSKDQSPIDIARPEDRSAFNELVYAIVRTIPEGRVMAYGQIARLIPAPASLDPLAYRRIRARWVGYALSDCPADVPWHRVVNQKGEISPRAGGSHLLQLALLRAESTPMKGEGKLDLAQAGWQPKARDLTSMIMEIEA